MALIQTIAGDYCICPGPARRHALHVGQPQTSRRTSERGASGPFLPHGMNKQRITHFTEELPFLSEQDKDWIMGRAIVARLGWT